MSIIGFSLPLFVVKVRARAIMPVAATVRAIARTMSGTVFFYGRATAAVGGGCEEDEVAHDH